MPPTPRSVIERISRPAPLPQHIGPRKVYHLPIDQLNPTIRIAHRPTNPLSVAQRVIFDHELVYIVAGRGQFIRDGQAHRFGPHQLFVIEPYVPHQLASDPGVRTEHIAVHFDLAPGFPKFASDFDRRPPYQVRLSHGLSFPPQLALSPRHEVVRGLERLLDAHQRDDALSQREARQRLGSVLISLLRQQGPPPAADVTPEHAGVQRAIAYIDEHFADELSVPQLAEIAGLSVTHFTRLFRQWTGQTPADALRRARIAVARQLLADPQWSIKQIAAHVGFKDPYHFSKVFRQVDGLSPTLYREALRAHAGHG